MIEHVPLDNVASLSKIELGAIDEGDYGPRITHHGEGRFSYAPHGGKYGVYYAEASLYSPYIHLKDRDVNRDGTGDIVEIAMMDLEGWLQLLQAAITFRRNLEARQVQERERKKADAEKKSHALTNGTVGSKPEKEWVVCTT
jgi:hypothetical protein